MDRKNYYFFILLVLLKMQRNEKNYIWKNYEGESNVNETIGPACVILKLKAPPPR